MKKFIFIAICLVILTACSESNEDEITYPYCVANTIKTILQNYDYNTKSTIKKYNYKGEIVYEINILPGTSGYHGTIVNIKCEVLCGYGGFTSINTCIDFDKATYIETVWTDPR